MDIKAIIASAEQKHGIPDGLLDRIAKQESSYNPGATGQETRKYGKAKGLFQFIDATSQEFGLDDPYDPVASSDAAGRKVKGLLKEFNGDVPKALAAYNWGQGNMKKHGMENMPEETRNYIKKITGKEYKTSAKITPLSNKTYVPPNRKEKQYPAIDTTYSENMARKKAEENSGIVKGVTDIPEAIKLGIETENSAYHWLEVNVHEDYLKDDGWYNKEELVTEVLKKIPVEQADYVMDATNWKDAKNRIAHAQDTAKREAKLAEMGITGFGGAMMGAISDPNSIALTFASVGIAPIIKGTRVMRSLKTGALAAGENMLAESALSTVKPTSTVQDVLFAGLFGFGLGGAAGGVSKAPVPKEITQLQQSALAASQRMVMEEGLGLGLTPTAKGMRGTESYSKDLAGTTSLSTVPAKQRIADTDYTPTYNTGGVLELGTARDLDTYLSRIQKHSTNPELTALTTKLVKALDRHNVNVKTVSNLSGLPKNVARKLQSSRAVTVRDASGKTEVFLKDSSFKQNGLNEVTLVHELVHAATLAKLRLPSTSKTSLEAISGKLTKALESKQAKGKLTDFEKTGKIQEATKSPDELLAHGLTDPEFQKYLSETTDGTENLFSKLVDSIRKTLGLSPKTKTALEAILKVSDELIESRNIDTLEDTGELIAAHADDEFMARAFEEQDAPIMATIGWGHGMEYKLQNKKVPPKMRVLAAKLFGSTSGYVDGTPVPRNVMTESEVLSGIWEKDLSKASTKHFNSWLKEQRKEGKYTNKFSKDTAFREFDKQIAEHIRGVNKSENPEVIGAAKRIQSTLRDINGHMNNPGTLYGKELPGLTEDVIPANDKYLPRKYDPEKTLEMVQQFGEDAVVDWYALAIKAQNDQLPDALAKKYGKAIVKTTLAPDHLKDPELLSDLAVGRSVDTLKEKLMKNGGMSTAEADEFVATVLQAKDSTSAPNSNLKHRIDMDETFKHTLLDKQGNEVEVSLSNFIYDGAFEVLGTYVKRMGADISLASVLDIRSKSEFDALVRDALGTDIGHKLSAKLIDEAEVYWQLQRGMPLESWTPMNKSMQMAMNYNVVRLMGSAVYNQFSETSNLLGTMSAKSILQSNKGFRSLINTLRKGESGDELIEGLEGLMGGAGSDLIYMNQHRWNDEWTRYNDDAGMGSKVLDGADNLVKNAAGGVLKYTGMTPMMVWQKNIHLQSMVHEIHNLATGKSTSTKVFTEKRLAAMGLSTKQFDTIKTQMSKYSTLEKTGVAGQKVKTVDFDKWFKEDPESLAYLRSAMLREKKRVIQENDFSSSPEFLRSTVGKVVGQFLPFVLNAWNKQLQYNGSMRDAGTMATLVYAMGINMLILAARTHLNAVGMAEEDRKTYLEAQLAPQQFIMNSAGRMPMASYLPMLYDTVSPYPLFNGMRTTSDLSSIAANPTYSMLNTFIGSKKFIAKGLSGDEQVTRSEMRAALSLLPAARAVGFSQVFNKIAAEYPTSAQQ